MHPTDVDPQETREWLEALDAVVATTGPSAPQQLVESVIDRGAPRGAPAAGPGHHARTSTRSRVEPQAPIPGDLELEQRIRRSSAGTRWRWCCRPTRSPRELGGHIASFQSAATLYEVGFNHFWHAPVRRPRRRPRLHPGPLLAGHLRPRVPRGPPDRGAAAAASARRSTARAAALSSYPHPWLMPDFWQFPTVSMGLGPIMAIYQARFMKYLQGRGIADTDGPQGLGVPRRRRDGRARVAGRDLAGRARAARQPDLRRQLQPAAPGRPGARQRQDHPGARGDLPRRGLERHQGHLGLRAGTRCSPPTTSGHARAADGRGRRRRVPELQVARRRLRARALLRPLPRAARDGRRLVRRRDLGAEPRRPRPVQGVRRLRRGRRARRAARP